MRSAIGRGATWMVLLRMSDRVVGLVSTLVLARLLVPADFGLVAMAMSVIGVIELLTAFGFDVALIQNPHPQRRHFDTAWTLTIAIYGACAGLIALLAVPMAAFYRDPRVVPVMLVIGAGWAASGFENSRIVEFRRNMNFSREFVFVSAKRLIGVVVTVAMAIILRSYWALIAGMVVGRVAGVALSFVMVPGRPRLDLSAARELLSFSRWLLVNNAVLVGVVRYPYFLIGRLLGPQPLGIYALAYEIATLPATELSSPVNRAALPGYSKMTADTPAFKETFLDVGAAVVAVALPASAGLAVVADPLVRVLLGTQWLEAVPIIRILAISAALVAATGNNGVAHLALGYANFVTRQSMARLVVLVVLGLVLAPVFGIMGVAIAELCGATVCLLTSFPVVFARLGISLREYGGRTWRSVVATLGMTAVVGALGGQWTVEHGVGSALLALGVAVPVGAVSYVVCLLLLWRLCGRPDGAEKVLMAKVANSWGSAARSVRLLVS